MVHSGKIKDRTFRRTQEKRKEMGVEGKETKKGRGIARATTSKFDHSVGMVHQSLNHFHFLFAI